MSFTRWAIIGLAALALAGCSQPASPPPAAPPAPTMQITADSFGCIRNLTQVGRFYVGNLSGALEATLAVARSPSGGVYPPGSVVQLVPTEVMVKREAGFNAQTHDWEFFELDATPAGSVIRTRGHVDVVNRFGGNCLQCHAQAQPQWDMICGRDHGCAPIPLTDDMISALQKTDPRCPAMALTTAESEALQALLRATQQQP